jgi:hypothetical protein
MENHAGGGHLTVGLPTLIDLKTVIQDNPMPLHTKGICSLHDDVLEYCVAAPGLPRPIEFTTTKGDGRTLVVLKRIAPQGGYKADRSTITVEHIAPESRVR